MGLTLASTAVVLSIWVVLWLTFCGFAGALSTACRWGFEPSQRVMLPFLGYALCIGVLQLWHLFLPISPWTFGLFITFGLLCFLAIERNRSRRVRPLSPLGWKRNLPVFLAIAWLANRSTGPNTLWDSGLYHLSFISWSKAFAIVPGLGNLHDRLAFNNPSLLVHAMLELGPTQHGASAHLVNGFLCACWVPVVALSARVILRGELQRSASAFLGLAAAIPISAIASTTTIASTSTDVPAIVLSLAGCWQALRFFEETNDRYDLGERAVSSGMALVLLTTAVVVKLSAAILASTTVAAMVIAVVILKQGSLKRIYPTFGAVPITFSAAVIAVWMTRGIILSGYPAYPLTWFSSGSSWQIDHATADQQREFITASARLPFPLSMNASNDAGWFNDWLIQIAFLRAPVLIAFPAFLILASFLFLAVTRRTRNALSTPALPLAISLVISIGAWLLTAPSPRFGGHLWWMLAAIILAVLINALATVPSRFTRRVWLGVFACFAFLPVLHQMALIQFHYRILPDHPFSGRTVWTELPIQMVETFPSPLPKVTLEPRKTDSGLEVLVPSRGPLCWEAPLLCTTPYSFDRHLRLRSPKVLAAGFTTAPIPPEAVNELQE